MHHEHYTELTDRVNKLITQSYMMTRASIRREEACMQLLVVVDKQTDAIAKLEAKLGMPASLAAKAAKDGEETSTITSSKAAQIRVNNKRTPQVSEPLEAASDS